MHICFFRRRNQSLWIYSGILRNALLEQEWRIRRLLCRFWFCHRRLIPFLLLSWFPTEDSHGYALAHAQKVPSRRRLVGSSRLVRSMLWYLQNECLPLAGVLWSQETLADVYHYCRPSVRPQEMQTTWRSINACAFARPFWPCIRALESLMSGSTWRVNL